jgi:hypothetical protein
MASKEDTDHVVSQLFFRQDFRLTCGDQTAAETIRVKAFMRMFMMTIDSVA